MLLLSVNTFIRITGTPKHIHTNHMQRDTPPPHHPDKHIQHPPHGHTHAPQHLNIKALNSNRTQKVLKNESMDRSKCSTRHLLDVYFQTSMRISHSATMEFAFPVVHCTRKRGVIQTASVVHAFVYTFVYSLECMLSVLPAVPSPSRLPCSRARCLPLWATLSKAITSLSVSPHPSPGGEVHLNTVLFSGLPPALTLLRTPAPLSNSTAWGRKQN